MRFVVVVQDDDIIVSVADFYAVYFKPTNQPQLILRRRTDTDDHELLARAWQAANDKAREWDGLFEVAPIEADAPFSIGAAHETRARIEFRAGSTLPSP